MNNDNNLKIFFIKLISIVVSIIVIINVLYNTILADKLDKLNFLFSLNEKQNIEEIKFMIRKEIKKGLEKDQILNPEDSKLLKDLYIKIKKELENQDQ